MEAGRIHDLCLLSEGICFLFFCLGSDSKQESGHLQGLLQVWVQSKYQAQAW